MDMDIEQQGVINRIAEILEASGRVIRKREGALQSELDYWRLHRYARIILAGAWRETSPTRPVEMLTATRATMADDIQLMADTAGWWDARAEEMREAEEILARSLRPGESPDSGRAEDIRSVVAGQMSMDEFRRRASQWPDQTEGKD
jgi:hypothetical protein